MIIIMIKFHSTQRSLPDDIIFIIWGDKKHILGNEHTMTLNMMQNNHLYGKRIREIITTSLEVEGFKVTGPKFYGLDYTSTCADTYGLLALAIHMPKSNAKQNHVVFQNHRIISNTTTRDAFRNVRRRWRFKKIHTSKNL